MKRIICAAWLVFGVMAVHAGQATSTVHTVNVNKDWNGVFIQLDIPLTFNYEPACPSANWAFVSMTDPFYNSWLAIALAAKASGATLTIYTSGCFSSALGSQPKITNIDYGVRM